MGEERRKEWPEGGSMWEKIAGKAGQMKVRRDQ